MSKAADSGKVFLASVLAKLPESLRAEAEKAFTAPEAADALTLLGDGVLARADYSKQMDTLAADRQVVTEDFERLNGWYAEKKAVLDKYPTLGAVDAAIAAAKGEPPLRGTEPKVDPPTSGLTQDDLVKAMNERDQGYAAVLALSTTLATQHLKEFGEVLDMSAVIAHANAKKLSLKAAYQDQFADQLRTKAEAAEAARIQKLVDEKYAERLKAAGDHPFPLRDGSRQPSVLDVIEQKGDPSKYTVDSAMAEYDRLTSVRG